MINDTAEPSGVDSAFLHDVLVGLSRAPKSIPCKYLYDATGSRLFEAICEVPAYYPTRVELAILEEHGEDITSRFGEGAWLVELGSGASRKTRALLDRAEGIGAYVPIDISRSSLDEAVAGLRSTYPRVAVLPVCDDYTRPGFFSSLASSLRVRQEQRRRAHRGFGRPGSVIVFFPGSTIGNLTPDEAERFLGKLRVLIGPSGGLLVGVDTKKEKPLLDRAYNDPEGVTAAFNRNLLSRINGELEGTFDLAAFHHEAEYVAERSRVEMRLRSDRAQAARVAARPFRFGLGERILTEYSYKYAPAEFAELGRRAGLVSRGLWTDPSGLFSVHFLVANG